MSTYGSDGIDPSSTTLTCLTAAAPGEQPFITVMSGDRTAITTVSRHVADESSPDAGAVVVTVSGDLDLDTTPPVRGTLYDAIDHHRRTVLDLEGVRFFGAAGANLVVAAHVRAGHRGAGFALRGVSGPARRVLSITGVDLLVTVEEQTGDERAPAE